MSARCATRWTLVSTSLAGRRRGAGEMHRGRVLETWERFHGVLSGDSRRRFLARPEVQVIGRYRDFQIEEVLAVEKKLVDAQRILIEMHGEVVPVRAKRRSKSPTGVTRLGGNDRKRLPPKPPPRPASPPGDRWAYPAPARPVVSRRRYCPSCGFLEEACAC